MRSMLFLLVLSLLIAGCESGSSNTMVTLESKLSESKERVETLEAQLDTEQEAMEKLRDQLSLMNKQLAEEPEPAEDPYGNLVKAWNEDLNGDGGEETISFYTDERRNLFTLKINEIAVTGNGDNLDNIIETVDIDKSDKIKEFAICESGPSGDDRTYFYYWDPKRGNIVFMGKIHGKQEYILYPGDGAVTTTMKRAETLHTWFRDETYRLTDQHVLETVPQELYEMNTEVKVKREFELYKKRESSEIAYTLKPGETVLLVESDDRKWSKVRNKDGQEGWFAIEEFNRIVGMDITTDDVFEGLSHAD